MSLYVEVCQVVGEERKDLSKYLRKELKQNTNNIGVPNRLGELSRGSSDDAQEEVDKFDRLIMCE